MPSSSSCYQNVRKEGYTQVEIEHLFKATVLPNIRSPSTGDNPFPSSYILRTAFFPRKESRSADESDLIDAGVTADLFPLNYILADLVHPPKCRFFRSVIGSHFLVRPLSLSLQKTFPFGKNIKEAVVYGWGRKF